jgi:ABC-type transport system substrate-binding protein
MSLVENIISAVKSHNPKGTVRVVDHSPLNWLYITYNTVEELVRTDERGHLVPAAMKSYKWVDDRTLEIKLRENKFQDGEPVTVKRSFEEMMRWKSPHPPGTQFNQYPSTRCEIVDEETVHIISPKPDGMTLGKLRAMHVMNSRFWETIGFGYKRSGSGEGHW